MYTHSHTAHRSDGCVFMYIPGIDLQVYVRWEVSVSCCVCSLAERAGIRPDTKSKQVASLLLRSLDDSSRADMMRVSEAHIRIGTVRNTTQHTLVHPVFASSI